LIIPLVLQRADKGSHVYRTVVQMGCQKLADISNQKAARQRRHYQTKSGSCAACL